ncbi:MAG: HEAT repeat domain-containing protein [Thermoplasmata archaeon YP2-bin.285]|uniref:HEAT repeat domain-containing protein n=1 Tax=Candidatus Sysuiplasma superficiale TaxID=2823368 RepID=A0A8J7YK88_9ARCH|nr:HEAT repeat domain-containing protein [Candidatus Sysuiplasma superficiale]
MDYDATVTEMKGRFELPGAEPKYPRDIEYRIEHMKLHIRVDIRRRSITGRVDYNILRLETGTLEEIVLDAKEMEIEEVLCQGRQISYSYTGGAIHIPVKGIEGRRLDISISYSCSPEAGFYFVSPDESNPGKPWQAWSQGEDEYSGYWFPCFDYPNMKYTTEISVTADEQFTSVSNGKLMKVVDDRRNKKRTFVWFESVPHSTYLNSVAVGEFAVIEDRWKNIPVTYYVQKGREEEAKRSFGKTPKMIDFFSKLIGVDYPYEKYSQVAVSDFIWGGMENVSATTQTDETLHDARAENDFPSTGLVAHELAHQWWGDLLTAKDWSNIWLNEGFATYFDGLFREHDEGEDEFHVFLEQCAEAYFKEDAENYRRPIVQRSYLYPAELFDKTTYQKGALVLHMLRKELGDDVFFHSISNYCKTNMLKNVETADLIRAIEETSGRNLQWFFDQWVYGAGFPELAVRIEWNGRESKVKLVVKQKQKTDAITPVFRLSLPISIAFGDGRREDHVLDVRKEEESFEFKVDERPCFISIDACGNILKKIDYDRPVEDAISQLKNGTNSEKISAARELSRRSERRICEALSSELKKDNFWGVHAACAEALGRINRTESLEALHSAVRLKDSRSRKQVVKSIGIFRDSSSSELLRTLFEDESYAVGAEAVTAYASIGLRGTTDVMKKAASIRSHLDVVKQAAITAFRECGEASDIEYLKGFTAPSYSWRVRGAALRTIAEIGRDERKVREFVYLQLKSDNLRYRQAAIEAAEIISNREGIGELEALVSRERDGRLKRRALEAIARISASTFRSADDRYSSEVSRLRAEVRELRRSVELLEREISRPARKGRRNRR